MKRIFEDFHDWFFSEMVDTWVYRTWLFMIGLLLVDLILKAFS